MELTWQSWQFDVAYARIAIAHRSGCSKWLTQASRVNMVTGRLHDVCLLCNISYKDGLTGVLEQILQVVECS